MTRDRRPLTVRVRDDIRKLIDADGLGPGDQVPTEADLAARFAVARTTVREALKLLEQDGLIEVRHGRGRFVSALPRLERPITRLESVTEMMRGLDMTLTNRVLGVASGLATADEREALEIEAGTEIVRLERLRLQGDDPLIYSIDVLPRTCVLGDLGEIDWSGSLLELLDSSGSEVVAAAAQISAVALPHRVAQRLGLRVGQPWLLMVHRNLTVTGRPVVFSHDYYRGDQFRFNVLRRRGG